MPRISLADSNYMGAIGVKPNYVKRACAVESAEFFLFFCINDLKSPVGRNRRKIDPVPAIYSVRLVNVDFRPA
jgi:hypothetical protein